MAFTSVQKNLKGSKFEFSERGFVDTQRWLITKDGVPESELYFSIATDPDMPLFGDEHPIINPTQNPGFNPIYLASVVLEPKGHNKVYATLVYQRPNFQQQPIDDTGDGVIEVGATAVTLRSEKDTTGTQITVQHDFSLSEKPELGLQVQGGTVDVQVPQSVFRQQRHESAAPLAKSLQYVGRVNDAAIWTGAARTWLCTGITGRSENGGDSYLVTYEFQYNPETWDQTVIFIDSDTGRPPPGLVADTGVKTLEMQDTETFSNLDLDF